MKNTVIAEYEQYDDVFGFTEYYVKGEKVAKVTVKKIAEALAAELGKDLAKKLLINAANKL